MYLHLQTKLVCEICFSHMFTIKISPGPHSVHWLFSFTLSTGANAGNRYRWILYSTHCLPAFLKYRCTLPCIGMYLAAAFGIKFQKKTPSEENEGFSRMTWNGRTCVGVSTLRFPSLKWAHLIQDRSPLSSVKQDAKVYTYKSYRHAYIQHFYHNLIVNVTILVYCNLCEADP